MTPNRLIAAVFSGWRTTISQSCFPATSTCPRSTKPSIFFMLTELAAPWLSACATANSMIAAVNRIGPSSIRRKHAPAPVLARFDRFALTAGSRFLLFEFLILPQGCFGLLCAALTAIRETQLVIGVWLTGVKANGGFQTLDGWLQVAFLQKGLSQFVMSVRIIRFLPDDVPKHLHCFGLPLLGKQDIAEAVLGSSIAGIDRELGPTVTFRLVPVALAQMDHSGPVISFWQLGI